MDVRQTLTGQTVVDVVPSSFGTSIVTERFTIEALADVDGEPTLLEAGEHAPYRYLDADTPNVVGNTITFNIDNEIEVGGVRIFPHDIADWHVVDRETRKGHIVHVARWWQRTT